MLLFVVAAVLELSSALLQSSEGGWREAPTMLGRPLSTGYFIFGIRIT